MADRGQSDHIWDTSAQIDSTGSANAYVIETAEPITGYARGMPPVRFKANFGNTGSATANINGLGAVALKKFGGATDLVSGDIVSGGIYTLAYDGTNLQVLELHTGVLVTGNLADDSVTYAKMQNVSATSRILGRKTSGAGDVEECTLSEVLDFISSAAQGDILYRGASAWARLAAGTANHFLQTQGAGANPQYAGGLVLLTSGSVSSAATLDIVLTSYSAYKSLILMLTSFVPATDDDDLALRLSTDGGSTFDAGSTDYSWVLTRQRSGSVADVNDGDSDSSAIALNVFAATGGVSNVASEGGISSIINIFNQNSAVNTVTRFTSSYLAAGIANNTFNIAGSGMRLAAQNTDALRLLFFGGNITSGDYALFGVL